MRTDKLRKYLVNCEGVIITSYPNIVYYSGFTSEDAVLLVTEQRQILITDSRYTVQARKQAYDFEIRDITEGIGNIVSELGCRIWGFEEENVTVSKFAGFQKFAEKLVPMQKTVSMPRRVKSSEEIERIRKSEELASAAFDFVLNKIRPGMTEIEVASEIEMYMRKNGASGTSFDTIAASGVRSCMPHGTASDKILEKGDFLTLDFGCVLDGYCSDITRTVAIGRCTPQMEEIYGVVLKAQNSAIEAISAGKKCSQIDKIARDIISEAGYGENFGHSLGHSVGIEIHERPVFAPKSDEIIEIGNVITVEPGIYIDCFCGVRIEDVIAVGENVHNLTKSCKDLTII